MIGRIKGILECRKPQRIVVDVQGIGYNVNIPLSTFYKLPGEGKQVTMEVHTHVREDAIELFGFLTESEKSLFEALIGVSKIGPRLALNIMSGAEPGKIADAIRKGDVLSLTGIPGIGKKTAERLIYELKGKTIAGVFQSETDVSSVPDNERGVVEDVVSALMNLGYSRAVAEQAVLKAKNGGNNPDSVEEMLKESLKYLIKQSD